MGPMVRSTSAWTSSAMNTYVDKTVCNPSGREYFKPETYTPPATGHQGILKDTSAQTRPVQHPAPRAQERARPLPTTPANSSRLGFWAGHGPDGIISAARPQEIRG